jgi:hypothetical protein
MLALRDLMRPVGAHNIQQPACPICSRPLRLTRATRRAGLSDVRTYGCAGCGVWLTESADARGVAEQSRERHVAPPISGRERIPREIGAGPRVIVFDGSRPGRRAINRVHTSKK